MVVSTRVGTTTTATTNNATGTSLEPHGARLLDGGGQNHRCDLLVPPPSSADDDDNKKKKSGTAAASTRGCSRRICCYLRRATVFACLALGLSLRTWTTRNNNNRTRRTNKVVSSSHSSSSATQPLVRTRKALTAAVQAQAAASTTTTDADGAANNGNNSNIPIKIGDPFPPAFDLALYRERNNEQKKNQQLADEQEELLDENHYDAVGKSRGWLASRGQLMRSILNKEIVPALPRQTLKLEIGPFVNPIIYDDDDENEDENENRNDKNKESTIRYFDVLDREAMVAKARNFNFPIRREVDIDYLHPSGDITGLPHNRFSLAVSSHVLEHQLDLIGHVNAVSDLLLDGGYYVMFVPDKRYCFDYYLSETTLPEILDDYYNGRFVSDNTHKFKSSIKMAMTTHNDATKHWNGIHSANQESDKANEDPPPFKYDIQRIKEVWDQYDESQRKGAYNDSHNYQFTPRMLRDVMDAVYRLELTNMRVHRIYETLRNTLEFVVVLKKQGKKEE